ncbi:GTPase Era, mitochondrial [Aplochiton taeniatus]
MYHTSKAFRAGFWTSRKSVRATLPRVQNVSAALTNASQCRTGCVLLSPASHGFHFSPVCFINSDAILNRLTKHKVLETDGSLDRYPVNSVPPNIGEQISLLLKDPDQPANPKVLKVAIIGAPNAGKSTLSNQLLGRKLFAVSKKVHTTRSRALGVLTENDTQIILLDTPGLTTPSKVKKHQLENSLLVDPSNTVKEADLVVVLADVSDKWTCNRLDFEVLKCLAMHQDIPAVLVLNKVDLLKSKSRLLEITAELTAGVVNGSKTRVKSAIKPPRAEKRPAREASEPGTEEEGKGPESSAEAQTRLSKEQLKALRSQPGWPHFKDVFMLSATDVEDVETLRRYLVVGAKPGPWQYHSEVLTDQTPEEVCSNVIREKLLENLPQEVPYSMTQCVDFWHDGEDGELEIGVKLYVKKDSHMKMAIGPGGEMVARLAREAADDMSRVFLRDVKLRISVKVKN